MSRTLNIAIPAALLLSALALSACATKPEAVPVAAPAPVAAVAEQPSAPEAAVEPAPAAVPAPVAVAEQPAAAEKPAPKHAVRKARKHVAKPTPPEPVITPAPVVVPATPAVMPPEPKPPVTIASPAPKIEEPGFLEQYWLWLLGLVVVIAVIVIWGRRSQKD